MSPLIAAISLYISGKSRKISAFCTPQTTIEGTGQWAHAPPAQCSPPRGLEQLHRSSGGCWSPVSSHAAAAREVGLLIRRANRQAYRDSSDQSCRSTMPSGALSSISIGLRGSAAGSQARSLCELEAHARDHDRDRDLGSTVSVSPFFSVVATVPSISVSIMVTMAAGCPLA